MVIQCIFPETPGLSATLACQATSTAEELAEAQTAGHLAC